MSLPLCHVMSLTSLGVLAVGAPMTVALVAGLMKYRTTPIESGRRVPHTHSHTDTERVK